MEKVKTVFNRYDNDGNPKKCKFDVVYESSEDISDSEDTNDLELSFKYNEPKKEARKKRKKDNHPWGKKKGKK